MSLLSLLLPLEIKGESWWFTKKSFCSFSRTPIGFSEFLQDLPGSSKSYSTLPGFSVSVQEEAFTRDASDSRLPWFVSNSLDFLEIFCNFPSFLLFFLFSSSFPSFPNFPVTSWSLNPTNSSKIPYKVTDFLKQRHRLASQAHRLASKSPKFPPQITIFHPHNRAQSTSKKFRYLQTFNSKNRSLEIANSIQPSI
jgi:hypothetical protein